MLHKKDPHNLKPCPHMEKLVSAHSDGELAGVARWYTDTHIRTCPQCQSSLPFLKSLKERLQVLDPGETDHSGGSDSCRLAPERWDEVEKAWFEAEEAVPPKQQDA